MTDSTLIERLKEEARMQRNCWLTRVARLLDEAIAALSSPPSLDLRKEQEEARVDDSQYAAPLATASSNKPEPVRCFECGSQKVAHHKFWYGDLLPMCRPCFEDYIMAARAAGR